MRHSSSFKIDSSQRGVSLVNLLIVTTTIATILSLVLPIVFSSQRAMVRANAAQEFSSYLQRARSDSSKLRTTSSSQMPQITILNEQYYVVTIDTNGDGVIDPPIVINLTGRNMRMDGPFPRTFTFDRLGRVLDQNQQPAAVPIVQFIDGNGKTAVRFDGPGQPTITTGK